MFVAPKPPNLSSLKKPKVPKSKSTQAPQSHSPSASQGSGNESVSHKSHQGVDTEPTAAVGSARWLNILGIGLILFAITVVITQQFGYGLKPSSLGIVERSAGFGVAFGLILNLLRGMRPNHYAVTLLAAVVGLLASGKNIFEHTNGGLKRDPNEIVFGYAEFEWAFLFFAAVIVACALMLLWTKSWLSLDRGLVRHAGAARVFAFSFITWLLAYVVLSSIQVLVSCGLTVCPSDPASTGAQSFMFTFSISGSGGVDASISIPGFVTVMAGIGVASFILGLVLNHRMKKIEQELMN